MDLLPSNPNPQPTGGHLRTTNPIPGTVATAIASPPGMTESTTQRIGESPDSPTLLPPDEPRNSFRARPLRFLWLRIFHMFHMLRLLFTSEGRELRHVTGIFFRLGFSLTQVIVITVVLALAGSKWRSNTDPARSEFEDCDKLGIWNALWAVRAVFGTFLIIWEWRRYVDKRRRALRRRTTDIELANIEPVDSSDLHWGTEVRGPSQPETPIHPTAGPANPDLPTLLPTREPDPEPPSGPAPLPLPDPGPASRPSPRQPARRDVRQPPTAADAMFDRMDTFLTATGLIHFIVNHIWLYTTVHTCRINDPHVWYLGLGIASLGYLIVLELLLIAFIVFILGPILLLILNLIMLCLGRPVDRHGNVIVRAEIPKMDQSLIDKIPLVVYIPPAESSAISKVSEDLDSANEPRAPPDKKDPGNQTSDAGQAINKPSGTTTASPRRRRRYLLLPKRGGKGKAQKPPMWSDTDLVTESDPRFEKNDHLFVILESHRATCSICLGEFVEPKRKEGVPPAPPRPKTPEPSTSKVDGPSSEPQVEDGGDIKRDAVDDDVTSPKGSEPIQEGAGEQTPESSAEPIPEVQEDGGIPGEPLRLLACGHVFHKLCLDTWLSTTSGRCPVCNRKVEIPEHMQ